MVALDVSGEATEGRDEACVRGEHDSRGMSTPNLGKQTAEDVVEKRGSSSNIAKRTARRRRAGRACVLPYTNPVRKREGRRPP